MGFLAPIGMALMPALTSAFGAAAGSAATAGAAGIGASALGTGLGAAGGILSGISSYQQGMFQAKLAGYNAQLATQEAGQTQEAGNIAASEQLMKTGKQVGAVTAAQAAGGVDVGGGSAKQVQKATEAAGEYDASTIRYNAASRAYGLGQEAFSDLLQQKAAKQAAVSGLISGIMGAGSSVLGGASSIADKWAALSKAGALAVPGG